MSENDIRPHLPRSLDQIRQEIIAGFSPAVIAVYGRFLQWLIATGVSEQGLRVGDRAPDFLLPNAHGRLVSSRSLREKGPLVVSFFRGSWCPFCTAEICALQAALPDFMNLKTSLLAITPDTGEFPRELKRAQNLDLEILSDIDFGVGLSFGVIFSVPPEVRALYRDIGIDLPGRHGSSAWMLPIPATFVIDEDGIIRDAYVEADFTVRQEPSVLVERLKRMVDEAHRLGADR